MQEKRNRSGISCSYQTLPHSKQSEPEEHLWIQTMAWCQSGIIYSCNLPKRNSKAANIGLYEFQENSRTIPVLSGILSKTDLTVSESEKNMQSQTPAWTIKLLLNINTNVRLFSCVNSQIAALMTSVLNRNTGDEGVWNSRTERHTNFCTFASFFLLFKALLVTPNFSKRLKGL